MSEDKLISPSHSTDARHPLPAERPDGGLTLPFGDEARYPTFEPEPEGLEWRRYIHALLRYKWLLVLVLAVATGGVYLAWRNATVVYSAQGSLWMWAPVT